jgi:hypothetical protein
LLANFFAIFAFFRGYSSEIFISRTTHVLPAVRTCILSRMHKSPFHFTDPIQHENLTIQFLLGSSVPPAYLTLAEGCRLNTVEIIETGTVGRLSVHNRSPKKPLFIQLGELLKGGLQDRTIATDLVLDPGERYESLSVYCVEQSRWSKRREEGSLRSATARSQLKAAATFIMRFVCAPLFSAWHSLT